MSTDIAPATGLAPAVAAPEGDALPPALVDAPPAKVPARRAKKADADRLVKKGYRAITDAQVRHWHLAEILPVGDDGTVRAACGAKFWPKARPEWKFAEDRDLRLVSCGACTRGAKWKELTDGRKAGAPKVAKKAKAA